MTLDEAIKIFNTVLFLGKCDAPKEELEECLKMAIKALEQESALDKIEEEIKDTLYIDSLIFTELIDFKNGKIDADDVIEEFNRVTRMEVLRIIDKYMAESENAKGYHFRRVVQ